jgi:autotransporter-associated beta strand protein
LNTYGGDTFLGGSSSNGIISLRADNSIPDTSVVRFMRNNSSVVLALFGYSDTIAGLDNSSGGANNDVRVANSNATNYNSYLTLHVTSPTPLSYSGTVRNGSQGVPLHVIKSGPGTQLLSGSKTYTGETTVRAGTLDFGANNAVTSSVIVLEGGTLKVDGAAYAMRAGQTNRWVLNPAGAGTTGLLKAGSLDITAGVVDFAALGPLGGRTFILAEYTNLTGAAFATVLNLPGGCVIDYTYQGNKIALHGNVGTVFTIR